ncbi:MAG TPA: hypothetical protein VIZ65_12800 [Cellvibrionaceae bacterium]
MDLRKIGVIAVAFLLSNCGMGKDMKNSAHEDILPVIAVSLGMTIQQVEAGSTGQVRFYNSVSQEPSDSFHKDIHHQLKYVHPNLGFTIPDMERLAISSYEDKVTIISDRPVSHFQTIDEVVALSNRYMDIIDKAGWQRARERTANLYSFDPTRNYASLDEVKAMFLDKTLNKSLQKVRVASWVNNKDCIEINIERSLHFTNPPAGGADEKEYLITIEFGFDS